jgi:hypothetical protein
MPLVEGVNLRVVLNDVFFGDGPPSWKVGRGKSWERACDSPEDADEQRCAMVRKLDHHFKRDRKLRFAILKSKLRRCRPGRRCFSGACPVCTRALQRWFVAVGHRMGRAMANGRGTPPRFISIVPDFGRVEAAALNDFDIERFGRRIRVALRRSGIAEIHGALDVSLNHWENERQDSYFQFQWWGVIPRATKRSLDLLREAVNRSGEVRRPVFQSKRKWPKAALAYGIKSKFKRRVSFLDASVTCRDRAPCVNSRDRVLLGLDLVELMLFLDLIGLEQRLLMLAADSKCLSRNQPSL